MNERLLLGVLWAQTGLGIGSGKWDCVYIRSLRVSKKMSAALTLWHIWHANRSFRNIIATVAVDSIIYLWK